MSVCASGKTRTPSLAGTQISHPIKTGMSVDFPRLLGCRGGGGKNRPLSALLPCLPFIEHDQVDYGKIVFHNLF